MQKNILTSPVLLSSLKPAPGAGLTSARYNEWGRAVLEFQKKRLNENPGHDMLFSAYYTETEEKDCATLKSDVAGNLMAVGASISCWKRLIQQVKVRIES